MANRGLIRDIVNQGISLEFKNSEIVRKNIAAARNKLAKDLERDPSLLASGKWASILDVYLEEVNLKVPAEIGIERALNQGIKDGKTFVADSAQIPKDSTFYGWTPSIPVGAIGLAESEMATLIRKTTDQLKEKTLRTVQTGLALGSSIGEIQASLLGLGIRGLKGRDGVFRSATARAEMQARTITNDLINRGAMITYAEVDNLAPELGIKKVWQSVSDLRTSDRCISLLGQIRGLKENFQASDSWSGANPPSHPNCRSRVTSITAKYQKEWENRWTKTEKKDPPVIKVLEASRLIKAPQINPVIREIKEEDVAFMNPVYNAKSFNDALSELNRQNPELGKRLDSVIAFQEKRKLALLFEDTNYSGDNDNIQINKFRDFLKSRTSHPQYVSGAYYDQPGKGYEWLRLGTSGGHTGFNAPFILMRTSKLENKEINFRNLAVKSNFRTLTKQQKLAKEAYQKGAIAKDKFGEYLYGLTAVSAKDESFVLLNTYVHEMGHQVQNTASRANVKYWQKPANFPVEEHISSYSMLNDRETFAEGFTWYTLDPDTMKKQSPNYYNWIDEAWKLVK